MPKTLMIIAACILGLVGVIVWLSSTSRSISIPGNDNDVRFPIPFFSIAKQNGKSIDVKAWIPNETKYFQESLTNTGWTAQEQQGSLFRFSKDKTTLDVSRKQIGGQWFFHLEITVAQ